MKTPRNVLQQVISQYSLYYLKPERLFVSFSFEKSVDWKLSKKLFVEWSDIVGAVIYSLLVALNIGLEFAGFALLLNSSCLIGIWTVY